ncbi:MAG: helix-turn-helix domain-containing protein [Cyanobacteria bacterium SBLK]|nr:helix-turn-helix domain-containing protein [Cyanobacteria bacterium SBLK]
MNPLAVQISLGQVVRRKRSQLGYSQESFAEKVGLHRTYIGAFERGERNLSLHNLIRIANSLNISLSTLLFEAEQQIKEKNLSTMNLFKKLAETIKLLDPSKQKVLLEMAEAMNVEVEHSISSDSDLLVSEFATDFSNRLLIHHATHREKLNKKSFEYAFVAACQAAQKQAQIVDNPSNPGEDVIVESQKFSLKTQSSAKLTSSSPITISKLMEAAWLRDCKTVEHIEQGVKKHVVAHLKQYERILMLRSYNYQNSKIEYALIEIPHELLLKVSDLSVEDFSKRTPRGGSSAKVTEIDINGNSKVAFTLRLDGSVEKIMIIDLALEFCLIHGSWIIPKLYS